MSPLLREAQEKYITWTTECNRAFELIRDLLASEPILKLPQFNLEFQLNTDACNYGIGGVLTQTHNGNEHPVAFFSKHLSKQQRNYST